MATPYARWLLGLESGDSGKRDEGGKSKEESKSESKRGDRTAAASKPARSARSTRSKRENIFASSSEPASAEDGRRYFPKSAATRTFLTDALREQYLFSALSSHDLSEVVDALSREMFGDGDVIIRQGDKGTKYYVIESGGCDVLVDRELVGQVEAGGSFGELALMYNSPRAATLRAFRTTVCWTLDRVTFRRIMATTASSTLLERAQFLKNVPLLEPLSNNQLSKIASVLEVQVFADEDVIVAQGDEGDAFYIIQDGLVSVVQSKPDGREVQLAELSAGSYFGEMALLTDEPRMATARASGRAVCLALSRDDFHSLMGSLREVLDHEMGIRVLKNVPLLGKLSEAELEKLSSALVPESASDGQYIVRQGSEGSTFYILREGEVEVLVDGRKVGALHSGDYFGEMALLKSAPRMADVVVKGSAELLSLDQAAFERLLGPLESIMEREMERREKVVSEGGAGGGRGGAGGGKSDDDWVPHWAVDLELDDLVHVRTLGTGTFGRVKMVQDPRSGRVMALKILQKAQIVASAQQKNIMTEKAVMAEAKHPFILSLFRTFQTDNCLFMLLELVQGGELWTLLYNTPSPLPRNRFGGFQDRTARFYAAIVVEAFAYCHSLGVAYRDLKPENLLLDSDGYLKMVDFGFAKHIPFFKGSVRCERSFTLCGTPEYLAPELVLNKGHTKAVDYWALGILVFELISGSTPFAHADQNKTFEMVVHSDRHLKFPAGFDSDAEDLVRRLLHRNPSLRLGNLKNGARDIREHPYFDAIDWDDLVAKRLEAPFVPPLRDPLDCSMFDPYDEDDSTMPYRPTGRDWFKGF